MDTTSWQAFYQSDLQQVVLLLPVPALWLLWLLLDRRRFAPDAFRGARFVRAWAVVFCLETILDPLATGPLTRALQLSQPAATALMFVFVLLGDFRVYLLVTATSRARALGPTLLEAGAWTLVVPVFAGAGHGLLGLAFGELPGQVLWLVYELGFVAVAAWLRWRVVPARLPDGGDPRRQALSRVLAYVLTYYLLWATADLLILAFGLDAAWLLRVVPNQLYYAFFVPFVCVVFWRR